MRKIKQALYSAAATAIAVAPLVAGAADTPSGFKITDVKPTGLANKSIFDLVSTFMNWLLGLVGVLAVIAFVVSGIFYLTAAGNEERIKTAKDIMLYAIIGIVVALLGLIIVNAVAGLTSSGSAGSF